MTGLFVTVSYVGDLDDAVQLAWQAGQIAPPPGTAARVCGYLLAGTLVDAGTWPPPSRPAPQRWSGPGTHATGTACTCCCRLRRTRTLRPGTDRADPNEGFKFSVTAKNMPAPNGIALTNVRYMVSVDPASGATVQVPGGGAAIDGHGRPLDAGSNVTFFNFDLSGDGDSSYLRVGQAQSLTITGTAGPNPGTIPISAKIQADPDINSLFPRNYESAPGDKGIPVTPTQQN